MKKKMASPAATRIAASARMIRVARFMLLGQIRRFVMADGKITCETAAAIGLGMRVMALRKGWSG